MFDHLPSLNFACVLWALIYWSGRGEDIVGVWVGFGLRRLVLLSQMVSSGIFT